jgi:4-diphosphocytidyl-2-C-methyl-D-erythritol kinase
VRPLPPPRPFGLVILPSAHALSTPDVYRAFDALGGARSEEELARLETGELPPHNDLQDAARKLCPAIDPALAAVEATGAQHTMVSGSGPTVFGVFPGPDGAARAADAAARVGGVAAEPVEPEFAAVRP